MLRQERDYLLRMIAAAAAMVARLRKRLMDGAPPVEVLTELRVAERSLFGNEAGLLRALDPASASHAIGDRERVAAWVDLLRLEAEALRKSGDASGAAAVEQRASALATIIVPQVQ
jgi:hypothetical protein